MKLITGILVSLNLLLSFCTACLCSILSLTLFFKCFTDSMAPATIEGGIDVVKINPDAKDLTVSTKYLLPVIYPPITPYALAKVPSIISI